MLQLQYTPGVVECGCDEAGRGCLAGPVVAAAVILHPERPIHGLNDSKKLNERKRDTLSQEIKLKALEWAIGLATPQEIDKLNILQASFLAMHRAVEQLTVTPELLLIDGNRFKPYANIPHVCLIKGDGRFQSIAAASILAKTHRDALMLEASSSYPEYGWGKNKGYPTSAHFEVISKLGTTPFHRKSFRLSRQLELF